LKYIPITEEEKSSYLKELNLTGMDELFRSIPEHIRVRTSSRLTPPMSEIEIRRYFATENSPIRHSFLGGNGHHHYIPSIISPIVSRGEFLTAYTPYQPEISQGTLQAMFEFQSMMANLMGVEVSNASMYDGSTAMLEAALMAMRITGKRKVLVSDLIHPEYLHTMHTYSQTEVFEYRNVRHGEDGKIDPEDVKKAAKEMQPAALVIQSPNFSGIIENISRLKSMPEMKDVLLIVVVTEALSMGLLSSPGSQGADIVCGEAQSFGIPLSFGGPWLGFLGSSSKHVRNMPGRLVGEAKDAQGKRAYVVTLSTREQHIRREKATSNICTNQGLMALRATIYLSLMGREGLRQAALRSAKFAHQGRKLLAKHREVKLPFGESRIFNEFIIDLPVSAKAVFDACVKSAGIAPGNIIGEKRLLASFNETMSPTLVEKWAHTLLHACRPSGENK